MADVLIAGGGLAGSALAIQLGRLGLSVELFERARFPREKPCGECLLPAGVAALERLGVPGTLVGAPFEGIRLHFQRHVAAGGFPPLAGRKATTGCGFRRRDLDAALFAEAARTPGVTAHTGVRVEAPLVERGRVVGLVVEGEPRRGQFVVGADGVHSRLRHALGLHVKSRKKCLGVRAHFHLADGKPPAKWVDIFFRRGYELYVTPLAGREILIAALARTSALGRGPDRIEEQFLRWRNAEPELAAMLEGAQQVSDILADSPHSGGAHRGIFPGFVLLGDAAGSTDPISAGGMTQALLTAELLAQHVAVHAAQRQHDGIEWLASFDRDRRAMLRDFRILTSLMLTLADHTWLLPSVLRVFRFSPALFSRFLGVSSGARLLWGGAQGDPLAERPRASSDFTETASGQGD